MAPSDRRRTDPKSIEPVGQAIANCSDREQANCRGELGREGEPVESPGDVSDDHEIGCARHEPGAHEASPIHEQSDGVGRLERRRIGVPSRNRERRHAEFLLACHMEWRAARGEDAD